MFRKNLVSEKTQLKDQIKWRGHEITRIEAFSDAAFAFAITLLIMSVEVPKNYKELMHAINFAWPFGICFGLTMVIWYQQNLFFRRYGLHDFVTIMLNCILIFLVLVYMFPLKFLIGAIMTNDFTFDNDQQVRNIFCMYSGGFGCFYFLFTLMYLNAYRNRSQLKLSDIELFETFNSIYSNIIIALASMSVVLIALTGNHLAFLGFVLIGPAMAIFHSKRKKIYKKRFPAFAEIMPEQLEPVPDDRVEEITNIKQV